MNMTQTYQSTVEYDSDYDEYRLTLPEELLDHVGWEEGDVVEWSLNKDGTVLLQRAEDDNYEDNYGGTENDPD